MSPQKERILIVLLLNDGKTQREIANFLGCSLRKIAYWCVHGDPENLESLKDEKMSGNYHKATEEYIDLLLKIEEYISISKEKPKLLQIWFWDESGFS